MQYARIVITLGACLAKLLRTAFERRRAIRTRRRFDERRFWLDTRATTSTGTFQVTHLSVESCIRLFRCADSGTSSPYTS